MYRPLLFALLVVYVAGKDVSTCVSLEGKDAKVCTQVLGQSGKIVVGTSDPPTSDDNRVTISFNSIKELSADDAEVGKGKDSHSINSFASQTFVFSDIDNDAKFQDIGAVSFNFTAELEGPDATLAVTAYIFTEDGNITNGDEWFLVQAGNMKFNVEIDNWAFCKHIVECKQGSTVEAGEKLDFMMDIKGKGNAAKKDDDKSGTAVNYDLGGANTSIILSTMVSKDGEWMEMESDYPMVVTTGGKQSFTFRFPRGERLLYDPTIDMGITESSDGSMTLVANALLVGLAALLTRFAH
ncbi:PREDICTED: skeletal aspartic acid-rich protein 2-like [Priapulus caudatus]|uniref:Skeletal aspartic acid-rich protein 2-like n=1 Tax=Priapulus caudatus TaxID=37621 RepID=A0ABM1DX06_PRICU|nr:PREDICTED: skeletal aspartic acid-rich protein 2-like [Priapulus caudatus]